MCTKFDINYDKRFNLKDFNIGYNYDYVKCILVLQEHFKIISFNHIFFCLYVYMPSLNFSVSKMCKDQSNTPYYPLPVNLKLV